MTKTRYAVGRDRDSEAYVKRFDAVIVDQPDGNGRYEYEVIQPQRRDDGTYVVDIGAGRFQDYVVDIGSRSYNRAPSTYEAAPSSTRPPALVHSSRGGGSDGAVRGVTYKDVQVMEDVDDDRYSRRGRGSEKSTDDVPPPPRLRSAIRGRNNSPPTRQRQRSVGFYRDEISHHDASESRHERPVQKPVSSAVTLSAMATTKMTRTQQAILAAIEASHAGDTVRNEVTAETTNMTRRTQRNAHTQKKECDDTTMMTTEDLLTHPRKTIRDGDITDKIEMMMIGTQSTTRWSRKQRRSIIDDSRTIYASRNDEHNHQT